MLSSFVRNDFSFVCNSWLHWLNINRKPIVQNELEFVSLFLDLSVFHSHLRPPLSTISSVIMWMDCSAGSLYKFFANNFLCVLFFSSSSFPSSTWRWQCHTPNGRGAPAKLSNIVLESKNAKFQEFDSIVKMRHSSIIKINRVLDKSRHNEN